MFETKFKELVGKHFVNGQPFLISGGSALNIINNDKLRQTMNVMVPPNPSDCGLSLGYVLQCLKPSVPYDGTFTGPEVWDKNQLAEYVEQYDGKIISTPNLCNELVGGKKIIGIVRGRSELGPRALGHRSIICHAAAPGMKDILNKKVKHREEYRPFAPVVRVEESHKFFNIVGDREDYRWMSFCPEVKEEYREALQSITHIDNTARLQTVNEKNDPFLHTLLTTMMYANPHPVLLNTSFNLAGKPILNSYKDAIDLWQNSEMDGLVLEDYYLKK